MPPSRLDSHHPIHQRPGAPANTAGPEITAGHHPNDTAKINSEIKITLWLAWNIKARPAPKQSMGAGSALWVQNLATGLARYFTPIMNSS